MAAAPPSSEHIADSFVFRATLRRDRLAARMALDEKARATLSARIETHLTALLTPMPPQTLSFCAPVRGEFDARPLASLLIELGWQTVMPIAETVAAPMSFRRWTPSSAMEIDRHGIPIPATDHATAPGIMLIPLLAFDNHGFRLGYGGGYFDRTLATLVPRPLAIGVGFELARAADVRPQAHDIPLDVVVTEAGLDHHSHDH